MSIHSRPVSTFASRVPALSIVVLALLATAAAAQDTTGVGAIRGVVVDAAGGELKFEKAKEGVRAV